MRLSFRVCGRVQGIGFRWFVKESASSRGICGWVRNTADGAVEGEAQGSVPELDGFLKEIKSGHPLAAVGEVQTQEMLDSGNAETDFQIKRSEQPQP